MKQYVIDEIRAADHDKIKAYLDAEFGPAEMGGIYWIPVAEEMLNEVQKAHKSCQPLFFALEFEPERLSCELLIRTKSRIRCDCISYATESQRNWLISVVDAVFEKLEIHT
jgi:hypothetical protein